MKLLLDLLAWLMVCIAVFVLLWALVYIVAMVPGVIALFALLGLTGWAIRHIADRFY